MRVVQPERVPRYAQTSPARVLVAMIRGAPKPLSRGWPVAAAFGAFGIAVEEDRRAAPTLPTGGLERMVYLYAVAVLVTLGVLVLLALVRVGL